MSNPANGSRSEDARTDKLPKPVQTEDTIERYETDDGTVIYDAANPLAWIYSEQAEDLIDYQ